PAVPTPRTSELTAPAFYAASTTSVGCSPPASAGQPPAIGGRFPKLPAVALPLLAPTGRRMGGPPRPAVLGSGGREASILARAAFASTEGGSDELQSIRNQCRLDSADSWLGDDWPVERKR